MKVPAIVAIDQPLCHCDSYCQLQARFYGKHRATTLATAVRIMSIMSYTRCPYLILSYLRFQSLEFEQRDLEVVLRTSRDHLHTNILHLYGCSTNGRTTASLPRLMPVVRTNMLHHIYGFDSIGISFSRERERERERVYTGS